MREMWFRTLSTVAIALLLYLIVIAVVAPAFGPWLINILQGPFGRTGAALVTMLILAVPPVLFATGAFTLLESHRRAARRGDDETRCRRCGHILRGLTEPRCPECGERI